MVKMFFDEPDLDCAWPMALLTFSLHFLVK